MTWGTVDEVRDRTFMVDSMCTDSAVQVNCPKSGVAFFNKLDLKDKKLVEYQVRALQSSAHAGNCL